MSNDQKQILGTAVITGASAGLGKIYADRLAKRGYDLLLVARRTDLLHEITQSLQKKYGIKVNFLAADLASPADLEIVVSTITKDSSVTLLVNNAGGSTLAPIAQTKTSELQAMVGVNIMALARLTAALLPSFKERNKGSIINIASVLGFHTFPFSSIYSGTKAFVVGYTRGLLEEVAGTNVAVQLVMPAATATDIWEHAGVPLSNLDPATVMKAEHCVDAALAGFDQGEQFTFPSLEDMQLWSDLETARMKMIGSSQTGTPASRYKISS